MARKPSRIGVVYSGIEYKGKPVVVERLRRTDNNMATATAIQRVMRPAYEAQLEVPTGTLPTGLIRQQLFDDESKKKVRAQQGRMSSHTEKYDSQYWVLRDPDNTYDYVGLAKVSRRGAKADTPFGHFNDVVVRPADQRRGLGSVIAHAAVKFGPMPPDQPMALEGYAGSAVNGWFEEWGMVARGVDPEGLQVGTYTVPQVRYITEQGLTVAGLATRLEERMPALAVGELVEL
jgi:GNAT superfamily N-acetyltransferase